MSCCWARTVLAMPAGTAMPPQMPCRSETCAMGDCRKCRHRNSTADPAQRLEELLQTARIEHPDPPALTRKILDRLNLDQLNLDRLNLDRLPDQPGKSTDPAGDE